ncbi:hypothetical protein E2C01_025174 [Portunus trituberculatus]|uniref:Uncharacterized protein n=1 Tax=Portunus trituberculatus TaxID=210409 RepID=A0A5B7EH51_PORTR|nr:hypothetical protein [Portunus trituberculatus]
MESKAFCLNSPPLTDCLQPLSHLLSFITIFRLTALLNLLTACLPSSCGLAAKGFLLPLIPILSQLSNARVNQYSQSFILFTGELWNSLPASVFPSSYDLNPFKREVSRHLLPTFG